MTEEKTESQRPKRDLVAISKEAAIKIDQWIEQINAKKTVNLSRRAFLSWYIERAPDNLSNGEINSALECFYDTEAHLRQLLREVRKAKENGDGNTLDFVLKAKKAEPKKESSQDESDPSQT